MNNLWICLFFVLCVIYGMLPQKITILRKNETFPFPARKTALSPRMRLNINI